jgi:hypothetical protein
MRKKQKIKLVFTGQIKDFDTESSIQYWQKRPASERLEAVWGLVVDAWKLKGRDLNELRLDRTVALLKRF